MINNSKIKYIPVILAVCSCLWGCDRSTDEEKELADFSDSMSEFSAAIRDADTKINSLDTTDKNSADELLNILDGLDAEFAKLAEIPIPEQYIGIESLADQASENMSMAVSYYHSAYEAEVFNESEADVAYQYYGRAMQRVEYIGYILTGDEIPEDENVTVYEEDNDSRIIDKWLNDDDDDEEGNSEGSVVE